MRTIETTVYTFDELNEAAKEKARDWWRNLGVEFAWCDESKASIRAFIAHFGGRLVDWNIGPYAPVDYKVDATQELFRGVKLKDFKADYMPTGYCLDCDLWGTFYAEFKRTGAAKPAFDAAVNAGFQSWRDDMEAQLKDEYIDDLLRANEYEFTAEGKCA